MLGLCLRNIYVIIDPFIMSQHGNYSRPPSCLSAQCSLLGWSATKVGQSNLCFIENQLHAFVLR